MLVCCGESQSIQAEPTVALGEFIVSWLKTKPKSSYTLFKTIIPTLHTLTAAVYELKKKGTQNKQNVVTCEDLHN